jgi:SAM-dependent MidA family methyltransferase
MQAFKDHKIVDIFNQPGKCDLTANVDFAYLKESLVGLGVYSTIRIRDDFSDDRLCLLPFHSTF